MKYALLEDGKILWNEDNNENWIVCVGTLKNAENCEEPKYAKIVAKSDNKGKLELLRRKLCY